MPIGKGASWRNDLLERESEWLGRLWCGLGERCAGEVDEEPGRLDKMLFGAEAFGVAAGFEVAGKATLFFGEGFIGGEGLAPLEDLLAGGSGGLQRSGGAR
jgi:hypothetical protein